MNNNVFIKIILPVFFIATSLIANAQELEKDEAAVYVTVTDMAKQPEKGAKVRFENESTKKLHEEVTDSNGKAKFIFKQGQKFHITVDLYETIFDFGVREIQVSSGSYDWKLEFSVGVDYGEVYTLENVYFDHNKSTLRPESFTAIDQLFKAMTDNPNMVIEIAGHTDNQGDDEYNRHLSRRRAYTVVKYLNRKGIVQERLKSKGYGETQPVADNGTEMGRQQNRRTEVRIISQ
ncbi:MAG: OmpA family protein [Bacteroidetes bacterium]|nr:OmpA family protein [Bacteroidota bacterium]